MYVKKYKQHEIIIYQMNYIKNIYDSTKTMKATWNVNIYC